MSKKPTFEESYPLIKELVEKRRDKWRLTSISWMDFDDVAQIIYIHLNKKWDQWDWSRPLAPWVSVIIANQISNLINTLYKNFSRPCLSCPAFEGDNLCSIYGVQCVACPLYDYWIKKRKPAYDIKVTLPIETHLNEVEDVASENFDVDFASSQMHEEMKKYLRPLELKIYQCLFVDHLSEKETAVIMGYKTSKASRDAGYRTIATAKKKIIETARKIAYSGEIEFKSL